MSYNDYVPLDGLGTLPPNTEMDAMLLQQQQKAHQLEFQSTLEHRIKNIEEKLDVLAGILFQNRDILLGGIPNLHTEPTPVKKRTWEDRQKDLEEQRRAIEESGPDSFVPLDTQQGMLKK
jgi:hypothetical protein